MIVHRISLQESFPFFLSEEKQHKLDNHSSEGISEIHPLLLILPFPPAQPRDEAGLCSLILT